jgi:hypothetical protein
MFENCPLNYYNQRVAKTVKDQGGEATIWGERLHKMLEQRLKDDVSLPQEVVHYEPLVSSVLGGVGSGELHVEREMTLNKELKPTGWWDGDAWLRSKLDVLVIRGSTATVMDWKTGKRRVDQFQLKLFAAQTFAHFPEVTKVNTTLVWLQDMKMDPMSYTRDSLPGIWEEVLSKITRIEQAAEADNWPARPSGLCPYCPCRDFCEYARK